MSSHIRARKHIKANQLATLVTLAFPVAAIAQQSVTLPEVKVEAKAESPYKADVSANPKYTQPLIDTPQTISVIRKETITEQGASNLMEALRNTPGITTQLGEGGNTSAGDAFTMRGVAASQSSLFLDGIRDLGAITRDVYNLEQVEVVKGPAGGDVGRGAAAGYINLISKLPSLENATSGTASVNTGGLKRATADYNHKINDSTAVRLNAMGQDGGVDGRDYVNNRGWAFAPSVAFGLGTSTRVYAYAQFVEQNNRPDGGISSIGMPGYYRLPAVAGATEMNAASKVNRENYYGSASDYEKVRAQQATLKIEHDLSGGGVLRNITRMGKTSMDRVLGSPGNVTASGGVLGAVAADPSTWSIAISRQGVIQTNEILANQTSVSKTIDSGFVVQDLVVGLELMSERQRTDTLSTTGLSAATLSNNLYNPDPNRLMATPYKTGAFTDGKTETAAVYIGDTIKLGSAWQVSGSFRSEHYSTTTSTASPQSPYNKEGWLRSWKTGLLYKPATNGSIYGAVATSMTPPGSANFALNPTTGNLNNANTEPQEARSKEIGTKWDFFEKKLGLTAAYYETSIRNELPQLDPISNTYVSYGDRKVEGVELSAVGALTDRWYVSAGVATMETKVIQGTTGNNSEGASARFSPDLTATLWTTYNTGAWSAGLGARYVSEQKRSTDPSPATIPNMPVIPSYTVFDAMASYQVSKNVTVRLNLYNLTDKFYINSVNNNGARVTLGAPRTATLSASFQF